MLNKLLGQSLIKRLIFYVTLINFVFWALAGVVSVYVMYHEYDEAFDGALQITAERLLLLTSLPIHDNAPQHQWALAKSGYKSSAKYTTYQVFDREGRMVARSVNAPEQPYGVPLKTGFYQTNKYRIYSLSNLNDAYTIQVADKISERREAAREAMTALFIPILILIPISIITMVLVLRRQLSPIDHLSRVITKKDSGNMETIEQTNMPVEFIPIITSINHLLERLQAALEAERSFTSNSAHEIRTPIAAALTHTQVLRNEIPKHYHGRVDEVENSLQRLRRLSEKLLQLARADAQVGVSAKVTDLVPYILAVCEDFQRMGLYEGRLKINIQSTKIARHLNGDAFAIVLRNLIENALHYSPEKTDVYIEVSENSVTVINDCPAISAEQIAQFSQRFYRGDEQKEGYGLGFSIINALSKSMGIQIKYSSPVENNRGFKACMLF